MEVTALLCHHAEVQNNLLYINGGGVERVQVPRQGPHLPVTVAVAATVEVGWADTNAQHTLAVELVDSDGKPVTVPQGPGGPEAPFRAAVEFAMGRPPHLHTGDTQLFNFALNLAGFPLPGPGGYAFSVLLDNEPCARRTLQVTAAPPGSMGG